MSYRGDWYVLWAPSGSWEVYAKDLSEERAQRVAHLVKVAIAPRVSDEPIAVKVGSGKPPQPNPPWTTRAVAKQWEDLQAIAGPEKMPTFGRAHAGKKGEFVATLAPLGCGAYGCVLETADDDVVLKITSDESEADFASKVLPRASDTAQRGFTRYLHVLPLESRYERRPLFALWRQAAQDVGKIASTATGWKDKITGRHERDTLVSLIGLSWDAAQIALESLLTAGEDAGALFEDALASDVRYTYDAADSPSDLALELTSQHDDADLLAAALSYFQSVNNAMLGTPLDRVGRALNALLDEGIFVGDIHVGNIGRVRDGGELVWVITDPGNVVVLPQPWA